MMSFLSRPSHTIIDRHSSGNERGKIALIAVMDREMCEQKETKVKLMTVGTRATTLGQLGFSARAENYSRFSSLEDGSLTDSFSFSGTRVRNSMDNCNCRSAAANLEKRQLPLSTVDHRHYF